MFYSRCQQLGNTYYRFMFQIWTWFLPRDYITTALNKSLSPPSLRISTWTVIPVPLAKGTPLWVLYCCVGDPMWWAVEFIVVQFFRQQYLTPGLNLGPQYHVSGVRIWPSHCWKLATVNVSVQYPIYQTTWILIQLYTRRKGRNAAYRGPANIL
jgi:hypothetical protein